MGKTTDDDRRRFLTKAAMTIAALAGSSAGPRFTGGHIIEEIL